MTHRNQVKADVELVIERGRLCAKKEKRKGDSNSDKTEEEEAKFQARESPTPFNLDQVYAEFQNDKEVLKLLFYCKNFVRSSLDVLPEVEAKEEGVVKPAVYSSYLCSVGIGLCFLIVLGLLLMQFSRNLSDVWLSIWVRRNPEGEAVTLYLRIYLALAVFNSAATLFRAFSFAYGGIKAATLVHDYLFDALINARMVFFDKTPFGRILNRFSSDLYSVDDSLPFQANIFLAQLFSIFGSIGIICISMPLFIVAVIPLSAIYFSLQSYYRITSRELKRLDTLTKSPLYSNFREAVEGTSSIRAFGSGRNFIDNNSSDLESNQRAFFNSQAAVQWFFLRLQLINVSVLLVICVLALFMRNVLNNLDVGLFGLSLSYALTISGTLSGLVNSFAETEKEMVSMERIREYVETIPREPFSEEPQDFDWPKKGSIYFHDVYVRYPGSVKYALAGVSFYIKRGQKVGIVGRTGSGKSTIFSSLFRIVEVSMGYISIDKKNTNSIDLDLLRSSISIIPQDPILFSGTIRYNLDPTGRVSDFTIWSVVDKCHLRDLINSWKGGLYHVISNSSSSALSAGQKQLICMARALLLNSKIVCIDEATSNIDRGTEGFLQDTLRNEFNDVTVLTIAHRIETIVNSDKIIVLNDGTLVEFDSPVKLLNNKRSFFYGLVEASKAHERTRK